MASVAFKAAVRAEVILASPAAAASPPSVPRQEPTAPSPAEVAQILEAAAGDGELFAFLIVAANTGARRGEVCALRWCDVDLDGRFATISRAVVKGSGGGAVVRQTKTGVASRVAISDEVVEVLVPIKRDRERLARLAGSPLDLMRSYGLRTSSEPSRSIPTR